MIHRQAVFGNVIDDARVRWQAAEKAASDAFLFATSGTAPDPTKASRDANNLRMVADQLKAQLDIATKAAEEARVPLRPISLTKTRQLKEEIATGQKPGVSLGTVAILASPLAVAALLVWRMR